MAQRAYRPSTVLLCGVQHNQALVRAAEAVAAGGGPAHDEAIAALNKCMVLRAEAEAKEQAATTATAAAAAPSRRRPLWVELQAGQLLAVSALRAGSASTPREWRPVLRQAEQAVELLATAFGRDSAAAARAEANLVRHPQPAHPRHPCAPHMPTTALPHSPVIADAARHCASRVGPHCTPAGPGPAARRRH